MGGKWVMPVFLSGTHWAMLAAREREADLRNLAEVSGADPETLVWSVREIAKTSRFSHEQACGLVRRREELAICYGADSVEYAMYDVFLRLTTGVTVVGRP